MNMDYEILKMKDFDWKLHRKSGVQPTPSLLTKNDMNMDYEILKMKDFDWKWLSLHCVYRVDKKLPFSGLSRRKEIGVWFNPSESVNFDVKRSPNDWNDHLDRCYDVGLHINRTKMWVSVKLKTGK